MQLYAKVFVFVAANSNRHSSNGCSPIFLATDTGKHTHVTLPILTTNHPFCLNFNTNHVTWQSTYKLQENDEIR